MRRTYPFAIVTVFVLVLSIAGAASAGTRASAVKHPSVVISTRRVAGLGTVLVNAKGRTLYMFVPDKRKKVTCVSTCAIVWPLVKLPARARVLAKGAVKSKLLGSDRNPEGGRVVTYHGWPLYTYIGDKKRGQATGQALNLNGGLWYVLEPSGKVLKTKLNSSG
jgi:predicted lipoprotein with Yx(FWY)xxD motif